MRAAPLRSIVHVLPYTCYFVVIFEQSFDLLAVFSELLPCPLKFVVPVSECFFFLEVVVELSVGSGYDNIWRPEEAKYSLVSFGNLLDMKMLNHFYHAYKLYIQLLQLSVRLQQISLVYKNFEVLFSSEADRTLNGFRVKVLFKY